MQHAHASKPASAFSLVELSIVLVILGLLVGGVLSGQSLIRAAELRSISSEYSRYTTAMSTFRDKYFALPGDMSNANSFWSGFGQGDGDGTLDTSSTATSNEISTFWIHLSKAAMIEGTYTAFASTTTAAGTNPKAKLSNAAWNAYYVGSPDTTNATYFEGSYGNALMFGGGTNASIPTGVIKPEEAWNVDTKLDDGKPATGSILSLESQGSTCSDLATSSSSLSASVYLLSGTSNTCALILKTGY